MKGINNEWRKKMQIKVDFNNMMEEFIGAEQGFKQKDFSDNKKLVLDAFNNVSANRGTGMMGWTELPYNQKEIVEDIQTDDTEDKGKRKGKHF